jgi:acyl-CoA thioesterase
MFPRAGAIARDCHDAGVDAAEFLGLEATADPLRWRLPVVDSLTTARNQLFGGVGLGAAAAALEVATGRPLIWGSAQYLGYAEPPAVLDLDLNIAASGKLTTQTRAVASVEGQEIFTVNAALGARPLELRGTWVERPDVPPPDAFPPTVIPDELSTRITSRMELRLAGDDRLTSVAGHGRIAVWARVPGLDSCTALLAMLGDVVTFGIRRVMGMRGSGNSLDNTLRVARIVPTDWVLLDIRIHSVELGFGHGAVHLWAEDGTLLGTAAQSVIVRPPDESELGS